MLFKLRISNFLCREENLKRISVFKKQQPEIKNIFKFLNVNLSSAKSSAIGFGCFEDENGLCEPCEYLINKIYFILIFIFKIKTITKI